MNKLFSIFTSIALMMVSAYTVAEPEFAHGHGAMEIFDKEGMQNTPQWVMIWIYCMAATFAASLFFVKNHVVARWVAACFITGMIAGQVISAITGLPQLSGYIATIHIIFWSPALYQLLSKRPFMQHSSPFSIWSGVMTFVIIFSFVFDIRDASIFLSNILM